MFKLCRMEIGVETYCSKLNFPEQRSNVNRCMLNFYFYTKYQVLVRNLIFIHCNTTKNIVLNIRNMKLCACICCRSKNTYENMSKNTQIMFKKKIIYFEKRELSSERRWGLFLLKKNQPVYICECIVLYVIIKYVCSYIGLI